MLSWFIRIIPSALLFLLPQSLFAVTHSQCPSIVFQLYKVLMEDVNYPEIVFSTLSRIGQHKQSDGIEILYVPSCHNRSCLPFSKSIHHFILALHVGCMQNRHVLDIEESITLCREEVDDYPIDHPRRPASLVTLAYYLCTGFSTNGREEDLDESIEYSRAALPLHPEGHPHRTKALLIHAWALIARFGRNGNEEDLRDSIQSLHSALGFEQQFLAPSFYGTSGYQCHSPLAYHEIGNFLYSQYEQCSRVALLDASIGFHQSALNLCHVGHPDQFVLLISLATALLERFKRGGKDADLEESAKLHRSARQCWPSDHPDQYSPLVNLANCLSIRFGHSGQINDLEESIGCYQAALDLCIAGHMDRPLLLSKLAFCLCTRFEQYRQLEDLNRSITLHREALVLNPKGHPNRSSTLSNLANTLLTRFQHNCQAEDLKECIGCHREALRLRPVNHIDRPSSLTNLAIALLANFEHSGKEEDLRISILNHGKALDLCPEGHRDRSAVLGALGHAYLTRFRLSGLSDDFEKAIQLLKDATAHTFSSVMVRLEAAWKWAEYARSHTHHSTLKAYGTAMLLLQRAFSVSPTLSMQHTFLLQNNKYKALALNAASYAIEEGNLVQAVELLEQGRTLLWSQMRGFRTPLERLSETNKELADRFKSVSRQLENLVTSNSNANGPVSGSHTFSSNTEQRSIDEMLNLKRQLLDSQEEIVNEVQKIPGFENFLAATPFKVLQQAASEGPVIQVNHCKHRSDALIILSCEDLPVVHVPLDREFFKDSIKLSTRLSLVRRLFGPGLQLYDRTLSRGMKMLWDRVVSKVVDKLMELGIAQGARIWWCPTSVLTALPFHAAGPFKDADGHFKYLLDDYVSSYTPTLGALINARSGENASNPEMLIVGDTKTLVSTKREVHVVRNHTRSYVSFPRKSIYLDRKALRETVIERLQDVTWIHFACHGILGSEPLDSSFYLFDEPLTLLDIIRAHVPNAEFAFLSACHTAQQGESGLYDEVLHLAAAVQFSGFRSVIGTMWEMYDADGPFLAEVVYWYMGDYEDGEMIHKRSAAALRQAVFLLRRRGDIATERWVNMVHIGA